jgi:hypothetical protein
MVYQDTWVNHNLFRVSKRIGVFIPKSSKERRAKCTFGHPAERPLCVLWTAERMPVFADSINDSPCSAADPVSLALVPESTLMVQLSVCEPTTHGRTVCHAELKGPTQLTHFVLGSTLG